MSIRSVSKKLQEKSQKELNEVIKRTPDDLSYIKEWIKLQPHLTVRTDDQWLISFLRGSKFSLERTKEKIDNHYSIKTLLPEVFTDRDPFQPELQKILTQGVILPLPNPIDEAGARIILVQYDKNESYSISAMMKLFYMFFDVILQEDDNATIAGIWTWINLEHIPLDLIFQLTPTILKKSVTCMQEAYPIRIKGLHFYNTPSAFESIFNLIKSLFSEKLKKRINMDGKSTKNLKFPKELMPEEYGGKNGSIEKLKVEWKKKMESYRDWFIEDVKYGSNEQLRTSNPKTCETIFGMEGTFRKLTVD